MTNVTLMNFADAPHVVFDTKNRQRKIEVGGLLDVELTDTQIERIKRRHTTLVIMPPDIADKATGPHMRAILDVLRNFDGMGYDKILNMAEGIFGKHELGVRPKLHDIRLSLAKRAKEAAHYIQVGALDTADNLLKPKPVEVKPARDGTGVVPADVVQGDPDPDEKPAHETQSDTDKTEQGENGGGETEAQRLSRIASENAATQRGTDGESEQERAERLKRAERGPGVTLPPSGNKEPAGKTTPRVARKEHKRVGRAEKGRAGTRKGRR